jgi:hypothetical protein
LVEELINVWIWMPQRHRSCGRANIESTSRVVGTWGGRLRCVNFSGLAVFNLVAFALEFGRVKWPCIQTYYGRRARSSVGSLSVRRRRASNSGIAHDGGSVQPWKRNELTLPPSRIALRCFMGKLERCGRAHGINLAK